jgi:hypothetical protein
MKRSYYHILIVLGERMYAVGLKRLGVYLAVYGLMKLTDD